MHSPAPAPHGPIVCTLHPNDFGGRLEDFRRDVFSHVRETQRPEPARLRLILAADADVETVRELLTREQECCAFLSFTVSARDGQLLADLEVPPEAAPVLDGIVTLAERAGRGGAR